MSATRTAVSPTAAPSAARQHRSLPLKGRLKALTSARLASAALALALGLGAGCDGGAKADGISEVEARQKIDRLVELFRGVDPTTTSDIQDKNFRERSKLLEDLHGVGRAAGLAALARLDQAKDEPLDVQWALLEAAAFNAPEEAQPLLEKLIVTYDGKEGTGLRMHAVRIMSAAIPQRALELIEPMLRTPLARETRPPQEELVRGWHTAAKKLGLTEARVLCDLVVDLRQPPDARYAAVNALSDMGGTRAIQALREVLVESASDGNIRRKAAQALLVIMPRKDFCALMQEAAGHESDEIFLAFLDDMLQRNCGGQ